MSRRRNIYIIGAQSTGKTTLVSALADHFAQPSPSPNEPSPQPRVLKETARGVLKRHAFTAHDIVTSKTKAIELQRLILEAQCEAETALADRWYISDRSGLDALAYARRYGGVQQEKQLREGSAWQDVEKRMRDGLIVVCEAGCDWLTDDGVRLMPVDKKDWMQMHHLFCQLLDEIDMKYIVLPSNIRSIEKRVDFVMEKWVMLDKANLGVEKR